MKKTFIFMGVYELNNTHRPFCVKIIEEKKVLMIKAHAIYVCICTYLLFNNVDMHIFCVIGIIIRTTAAKQLLIVLYTTYVILIPFFPFRVKTKCVIE